MQPPERQPGPQYGPMSGSQYGPAPTSWGPPQGPPAGTPGGTSSGPPGHPPTPEVGSATGSRSGSGKALIAGIAVAGLLGGAIGAAGIWALTDQRTEPVNNALDQPTGQSSTASNLRPGEVQEVVDKVLPSVVSIPIASQQGTGNGSGVILSSDGKILTNNHVAEAENSGGQLSVTFSDGKTVPARVIGLDPKTDLAVIQAEGVSGLKPAKLGSSSALDVGQDVIAIGAPLGLDSTVTSGIVSALNRPVGAGEGQQSTVIDAIQTDAAINPGNSGGPLVNMAGEVVGINSMIYSGGGTTGQAGSIGLGFAIPMDQAKPIAKQLEQTGKAEHALLGVRVGNAMDRNGLGVGAELGPITSGSAADEAGLREGDVITKVGDRPVSTGNALVAAVRSYRPGDQVSITYVRDGQEQDPVTVRLGSDEGQ